MDKQGKLDFPSEMFMPRFRECMLAEFRVMVSLPGASEFSKRETSQHALSQKSWSNQWNEVTWNLPVPTGETLIDTGVSAVILRLRVIDRSSLSSPTVKDGAT